MALARIGPFGFFGYLWLNHAVTGDFFAFTKIMHEHWYKKFASPWFGFTTST